MIVQQIRRMKRRAAQKRTGIDPRVLMAYDRWVTLHLDEMVQKHPGKVIAVYNGKLVAVGDTYKEVFAAARAQGITEQPFAMEVPRPENFEAGLRARLDSPRSLGGGFHLLGRLDISGHFSAR